MYIHALIGFGLLLLLPRPLAVRPRLRQAGVVVVLVDVVALRLDVGAPAGLALLQVVFEQHLIRILCYCVGVSKENCPLPARPAS